MLEKRFMDGLLKGERVLLEGIEKVFVFGFKEFKVGCGWGLEGRFLKEFSDVRVVTELLAKSCMIREVGRGGEDAFECGICVMEVFAKGGVDCNW